VGVQVVAAQDDRGIQLMVRGGHQASVIGFGHAAALARASAVDTYPVEQAAPRIRPDAGQPRHGHPARALPETAAAGVAPRRAQVRAFGGRRFCPASTRRDLRSCSTGRGREISEADVTRCLAEACSLAAARRDLPDTPRVPSGHLFAVVHPGPR